jgi:cytochrome c oxidase subunit 2
MNELLRRLLFLPPQASTFSRGIDTLHFVVVGTTMASALLIALVAVYFAIRYRASRKPEPAAARPRVKTTRRVEAMLTAVTLTVFLVFWVVGFQQYVHMGEPPKDALVVYVTAKQWMWKFGHEEGPSEVGVLTVPSHRAIKVVMTSRDVIHSFYVPAFRVKQDVIPGRYVTAWFEADREGIYDLFCAEYCGTSHSNMLGRVVVLSPEDYARWLAGARAKEPTSLVEQGRSVAVKQQCFGCHTIDGKQHVGPTWRGLYGSQVVLSDGRRVVADEAYLTRSMMQPNEDIVAGYKTVMPTYLGRLEAADTAALVAYMRALGTPETAEAAGAPPLASGTLEAGDGGTEGAAP